MYFTVIKWAFLHIVQSY